jgi:LPS sulfotransferase NodH
MIPYVIVGMPRTGSTLLATAINQHNKVTCFGELFHPVKNERENVHCIIKGGKKLFFDPDNDDAIDFLRSHVYNLPEDEKKAVGFKLFGDYVRGRGSDQLFIRLKNGIPDLKVVHIVRYNYLDVLVSREVARKTRKWVAYADQESNTQELISNDDVTLEISIEMAERFFNSMRQVDDFLQRHFGADKYYKIHYQDLSDNFVEEMGKIFNFLGVEAIEVKAKTIKQAVRESREKVNNYETLREHFAGTLYGHFFLDPPS